MSSKILRFTTILVASILIGPVYGQESASNQKLANYFYGNIKGLRIGELEYTESGKCTENTLFSCLDGEKVPLKFDPSYGWGFELGGGRYLHPNFMLDGSFSYTTRGVQGSHFYPPIAVNKFRPIPRTKGDPVPRTKGDPDLVQSLGGALGIDFPEGSDDNILASNYTQDYETSISTFALLGWGILESPPLNQWNTSIYAGAGLGIALVSIGELTINTEYKEMPSETINKKISETVEIDKWEWNIAFAGTAGVSHPLAEGLYLDLKYRLINYGPSTTATGDLVSSLFESATGLKIPGGITSQESGSIFANEFSLGVKVKF